MSELVLLRLLVKGPLVGHFFIWEECPEEVMEARPIMKKKEKKDISNAIREEYVQPGLHARGIVIQLMKLTKLKKKKKKRSVA